MIGGTDVKIRLNKISIQKSVIAVPEKPQKNWYQNKRFTNICKEKNKMKMHQIFFVLYTNTLYSTQVF